MPCALMRIGSCTRSPYAPQMSPASVLLQFRSSGCLTQGPRGVFDWKTTTPAPPRQKQQHEPLVA
jgi:hypothetical protein